MIEERSLGGFCYGAVAGFGRLCDVFVTGSLACLFSVIHLCPVEQTNIKKGWGVDFAGVHHLGNALQWGDDHVLFPALQVVKFAHKAVL